MDDVTKEGQELLSVFQSSKHPGGRRNSKSEALISDRIKRLVVAWKQLNTKMMERRTKLNQCSTYMQLCEEVRFRLVNESHSDGVNGRLVCLNIAERRPVLGGRS